MPDLMEFECATCKKLFNQTWFHLTSSYERVHFGGPTGMPEVETEQADGLAEFCSRGCLARGEQLVMAEERVPTPSVAPDIGPVETCARCSGPVDMSNWHITYSKGLFEERAFGLVVLEHDYVAVVCRTCRPSIAASEKADAAAEEPSTAV